MCRHRGAPAGRPDQPLTPHPRHQLGELRIGRHGRELVLVFDNVAGYEALLRAMPPQMEVRLLSSQSDGLAEMAAAAGVASHI